MKLKIIQQAVLLIPFLFLLQTIKVTAMPCEEYYFGLGAEKNYSKAFDCAKNGDNPPLLILMYINGDGTPVNLDKAEEVVDKEIAKQRADGWGPDATLSHFQEIIAERRENPKKVYPKLDYGDIAMTTADMNEYSDVQNRLQDQDYQNKLTDLRKDMSPDEIRALVELDSQFGHFLSSATQRMYLDHVEGTIRVIAAASYRTTLLDRHQIRIEEWLIKKNLPVEAKGELEKSDKELNILYQMMQAEGKKKLNDPDAVEKDFADFLKDYGSTLKDEESSWIKYRDAWVELLKLRAGGQHPASFWDKLFHKPAKTATPDINIQKLEESVRARLTKERVEELKMDPMTPDNQ